MKRDGILEAPVGNLLEEGKTCRMNIDRGDVPALEGALGLLPAFASPGADRFRGEPRGDTLGLPVGIELDVPAVRRDGDESVVAAVVLSRSMNSLLACRLDDGEGWVRHPRGERAGELRTRAETLAAARAHAHDVVRDFLTDFAHRARGILGTAPLNPNLLAASASHFGELLGVGRAMLPVADEILLGGQGLFDRRGVRCHGKPPGPITE